MRRNENRPEIRDKETRKQGNVRLRETKAGYREKQKKLLVTEVQQSSSSTGSDHLYVCYIVAKCNASWDFQQYGDTAINTAPSSAGCALRQGGTVPPKSWLGPPNLVVLSTHCGQFILRKNSKFEAIRCYILRLKCTKFDFRWGSAQTPLGELTALYRPPSCF